MTEAIERHEDHEVEDTQPDAEVIDLDSRRQTGEVEQHQAADEDLQLRRDELDVPERPSRQVPPALRRAGSTAARAGRAAAPHLASGGQAAVRHLSYTLGGCAELGRQAAGRATHGDLTAAIRQARADRDYATVVALEQQKREAANARWQRIVLQLKVTGMLAAGTTSTLVVVSAGVLIYAAVAALFSGGSEFTAIWTNGYWAWIETTASWIAWLATWAPMAAAAVGVGMLASAWNTGRKAQLAPAWAGPQVAARSQVSEPVTPSVVIAALSKLGIKDLRDAIASMDDGGASLLSPIVLAGCGVEVDVSLPQGAYSTEDIQNKRRKLAENLGRHEHELFITIPPAPRTIRLWIADSGALDEPIGTSPLVTDPEISADFYTGRAPFGQNLRGETARVSLKQLHVLMTGLSNQGKTAALRALALWLAFDPAVEFHMADLKGIGDWHMFDGLAETLIEGPGDEHVIATTEMVEWGVDVMEQRLQQLDKEKYPDGVPAELARQPGSGFHPIILLVDEAQKAFMCPAVDEAKRPYGGKKSTSRYYMAARKLLNQGRAVNVLLWQGTQDPTDENLPKLVREAAHLRMSLVVGTESQSRMSLGDKAVDGGAAPHKLRQGKDKGTIIAAGDGVEIPDGQPATTIRSYFIDGAAATEIVARAKERRGATTSSATIEVEQRDLLADVAEVLGTEDKVRATDVAARLRKLAPGYRAYKDLTAETLKASLETEHGVKVTKSDGVLVIRAERVRTELACRDEDAEGDEAV